MAGVVSVGVNPTSDRNSTIANGGTVGNAVRRPTGHVLIGMITDAALDSTTVSFQVGLDGTNYFALHDNNGDLIAPTVAPERAYPLASELFFAWDWVKIVGGTVQSGADTTIKLVFV